MNTGGSASSNNSSQGYQPLRFHDRRFSFARAGQEKILVMGRLALSLCLALLALSFLYQSKQIEDNLARQRLLEVSLQDLLVQSTALRHLDHLHSYQVKLDLESQGYGSAQEVVNQLAARLAIIETINEPKKLEEHTKNLRQHLMAIDSSINRKQANVSLFVKQWFTGLGALNSTIIKHNQTSSQQIDKLHQLNLILALLTMLLALGSASKIIWKKSALRLRVNTRLFQIGCESRTDLLTGLLNAKGWQHLCDLHLKATSQQCLFAGSIAVINIDYFKQFCDTYGVYAGETRLCELAETLKANFRPSDLIGRIGEHEFAVLLPNCTASDAHRIVERMRTSKENMVEFSAGICDIEQSQSIEHTMAMADQAMYQARRKDNKNS